jgi:hypothetical protein
MLPAMLACRINPTYQWACGAYPRPMLPAMTDPADAPPLRVGSIRPINDPRPMLPAMTDPADAPSPSPSPAVLAFARDAASLRAALSRLPRPLVCACGAVEGAPGAAPVGAVVRPLRGAAASVEAVCAACAPEPSALVSLGAPPRPRRPSVRAAAAGAVMTDVTPSRGAR